MSSDCPVMEPTCLTVQPAFNSRMTAFLRSPWVTKSCVLMRRFRSAMNVSDQFGYVQTMPVLVVSILVDLFLQSRAEHDVLEPNAAVDFCDNRFSEGVKVGNCLVGGNHLADLGQ